MRNALIGTGTFHADYVALTTLVVYKLSRRLNIVLGPEPEYLLSIRNGEERHENNWDNFLSIGGTSEITF
ncbi:MAG TPA: hypothetical protein VKR32_18175 [Puia sp.]|nr:hypothetical protein [Puia sp.]